MSERMDLLGPKGFVCSILLFSREVLESLLAGIVRLRRMPSLSLRARRIRELGPVSF
jgi:hypothetical protein